MSDKKTLLRAKLQLDLIGRSLSAAVAFSLFAVLFIFFHFEIQNHFIVSACLLVIASSLLRVYVSIRVKNGKMKQQKAMPVINLSILTNALSWSGLFYIFFSNLTLASFNSFYIIFLVFAFTNASVITLGSNLKLALLFQNLLIAPPFISYFVNYRTNSDSGSLLMCISFGIYSAYLASQTITYHKQLKSKALSELELEKSVDLLNAANIKLLAEKTRSENASRLAALGQMAGGIAHEINNPLAIISMSVEMAQGHLLSNNDNKEQIGKNLRVASTAINRIVQIIRSLKLISNSKQETVSDITLDAFFTDSLILSREKFKNANIQIQLENIPEIEVRANLVQVSQVLLNLLNNCYDALLEAEQENRYVRIYFSEKNDFIYISVENSGKPIDNKYAEKLFEPFFTTKEAGKGTGLGLSLCKSIVESLNGKIWHEREKSLTTFTFSLPKANKNLNGRVA